MAELIPDVDALIAAPPEEVGRALLVMAHAEPGALISEGLISDDALFGPMNQGPLPARSYPRAQVAAVRAAAREGWYWLVANLLIIPAEGMNGRNGYMTFSRRGAELARGGDFRAYLAAAIFPKSLMHPRLAEDAWLLLAQGRLDTAVFEAFREVEIAVRAACGFGPERFGVPLMRQAFNPANGPLSRQADVEAERSALADLFAGAIGSHKNPHSHRHVAITEPREAQEMLMLASHLLYIVDDRRPAAGA